MRFIRFFIFFLAPVFASAASAQSLLPGQWQTYTSMRSVNDIAIPSDSIHAWAVTGGGAYRVDFRGIGEPLLALRTTDGLTENDLRSVAADNSGNVFFGGSTGGFDEYHGSTGKIDRLGTDIRNSNHSVKSINSITVSGNKVYLATGYGITVWYPESGIFGESVYVIAGLPTDDSVLQVIDNGSFIYAAMHEGVAYLPSGSDLEFGDWKIIPDTSVSALASFLGSIYVGTSSGLYSISADGQHLVPTQLPGSAPIVHLLTTADTLYILDAAGTVYSTHDAQNFIVQNVSSYAGSQVTAFSMVQNAGLIAGTAAEGLAYSISGILQTQIFPPGPIATPVTSLHFATATDQLYVINELAGFSLFQPATGNWQDFGSGVGSTPAASYQNVLYDSIRDVTWFSAGLLYRVTNLGSANPVWDTFNHTRNNIPNFDPQSDNLVITGCSMIDMDSNFVVTAWASSGQGVISTHDGENFTNYSLNPPTPNGQPWGCVTQDFDGNYWVGTVEHNLPISTGVYYHVKSNNSFGEIPGGSGEALSSPFVNAILTDQDDGIWCGTEGGVQIISNPEIIEQQSNPSFSIRDVQFLIGQVVRTMAVDGVGNKWIGTDAGVFVVSPDGSDSVARYTAENSPLVSDAVTSIAIDPVRGEAYIGTAAGISRFNSIFKRGNPDYSQMRVYPNPVVQTTGESPQVYIDGLVAGSTVQIFTLNGKQITTIDGTALGSTVTWNGRDALGRQVASGMYLVSATSAQSGGNGEAKVVIVRR